MKAIFLKEDVAVCWPFVSLFENRFLICTWPVCVSVLKRTAFVLVYSLMKEYSVS